MLSVEIPNSSIITSRWCVEQMRGTLHFLLYHRLQIPVPYLTLGVLIKGFPEDGGNYFLERHRSEAVQTHQQVQRITEIMESQLITQGLDVEYAAIAFGPTICLAKEVWFLRLPEIDRTHLNENHSGNLQRAVANTMLTLITDNRLSTALSSPLPMTNVHILLKTNGDTISVPTDDCLDDISNFHLPRSCKTFLIDLSSSTAAKTSQEFILCSCVETEIKIFDDLASDLEVQCSQMTITEDVVECTKETESLATITAGTWFQLTAAVKGFRDVLSNGQKIWAS